MTGPILIAHRGVSSHAPENSLAALRAVGPATARGVELDVQTTADGVFVLHHDADVSGQLIAELEYAHLADVRLPNGEPLPTLAAALEAIDAELAAFIEIKTLPERFEELLLAAIDNSSHPGRCHVHSFDHTIIERLGRRHPALGRGLLSVARTVRPAAMLADVGADVLWQEHTGVDAALVEELHQAGSRIYAWTVDDPVEAARLAGLGVDGICTNRPEAVAQALEARLSP